MRTRPEGVTLERWQGLLDAVSLVAGELDLQVVLRRIAQVAADLVDARYGALGVLAPDGTLAQFVTVGLDEEQTARIGPRPRGRGILGELIRHPVPLRTPDLGAHPSAVGFPPGHPPMRSFLGVPVRTHGTVFGNLYLTDKRHGEFDADDEALAIGLAAAVGISVEHAGLYEQAKRRERSAAAHAEITTLLLSGAEPEHVLELAAERAADLIGADLGLIALEHDGRLLVEVSWGSGSAPPPVLAEDLALSGGLVTPTRLTAEVTRALWPEVGVGQALAVPLGAGVLVAARHSADHLFGDEELDALASFARQATVALELAQHRRAAERLSVFADRDRIARDLHDLVIQRLFATGMALQGSVSQIREPAPAQRVRQAVDDLDETVREIRQTIYGLGHDPYLPTTSLRHQVLELLDTAAELLGFAPDLQLTGPLHEIPPAVVESLLLVLREALSNVARHAGASHASVELTVGDAVVLVVTDDGCGLPEAPTRRGLANLEERAALLGGSFSAVRREAGGTELRWQVPVTRGASAPGAAP